MAISRQRVLKFQACNAWQLDIDDQAHGVLQRSRRQKMLSGTKALNSVSRGFHTVSQGLAHQYIVFDNRDVILQPFAHLVQPAVDVEGRSLVIWILIVFWREVYSTLVEYPVRARF